MIKVIIEGPQGSGKTTLALTTIANLRQHGYRVAAPELEGTQPGMGAEIIVETRQKS